MTTATMTAAEAVRKVQECVSDPEVRVFLSDLKIGGVLHQGDVYLHRVPNDWPRGKRLGTRQVAVGTTVGSRHIVEGDGVEVFEGKQLPPSVKPYTNRALRIEIPAAEYLGPVAVLPDATVLTHPEHAHHKNGCEERRTFQVTYQIDMATMRRQQD